MKLIASDFDGTLYRNGKISDRDRCAILAWQKAGNQFGLVTGRGRGILVDANNLGLKLDFALADSGAVALDGHGNLLHEAWFDGRIAEEYYAYVYDKSGFTIEWKRPAVKERETQLAVLLHTDQDAQLLCDRLNKMFGDRLNSFTNGRWINTVAAGMSKAAGIAKYAEIVGVYRESIWVVGDNFNDLTMIQAYDGYVVSTASDAIKRIVPNICEDIAHLIEIALK